MLTLEVLYNSKRFSSVRMSDILCLCKEIIVGDSSTSKDMTLRLHCIVKYHGAARSIHLHLPTSTLVQVGIHTYVGAETYSLV